MIHGRRRPRRRPSALAALLVALVLAGCSTGVPTTGPVTRVSAAPGRINPGVEIAPAPPGRNATQIEVVEGFLHAMASWQPDYAVARAYLTPEASDEWQPDAGVRVYAEGNPVTTTENGARLRAPVVGTLDPSGAYLQSNGTIDHDFALVRDAEGEWRISEPPSGLVISQYLFTSAFTRVTTYFYAPGGRWLVPDPRYFPRGQQAHEGAARAVVSGATDWLQPSVQPAVVGVRLHRIAVSPAGIARLELGRDSGDLDADQRAALVAQFAWTFRQFESILSLQVGWAGEDPWDIAPYGRTVPVGAFPEVDPAGRQGSRQLFTVTDGRIVRAMEGPQGTDNLVVAPALTGVSHAAVRSDALVAAAVTSDRQALELAPLSEPSVRPMGVSIGLRRPQFERQGGLWVSNDAGQLARVDADGVWQELSVDGLGEGRIEAFRVSPDGMRVALVVQRPGGQRVLGLARVVRDAGGVEVEGWRELTVSAALVTQAVLDVGWRSPDSLLVLLGDGRTTSVLAVAQDGSTDATIGPTGFSDLVELAVAPGVPPMVRTADGDVWRYNSDFRWSLLTSDAGAVLYP